MANQEHLKILEQDTATWNDWRKHHPEIQPDLSGATLSKTKLSRANLRNAILTKANLSRATLSYANLNGANLCDTNLSRATLTEATLSDADLSGADLSDVNLSGATLSKTNLSRANLRNAILTKANLSRANLSDVNLSRADLSRANLREATLSRADLSRADLSNVYLSRANLSNANLSGATLSRVNLSGTNLSNAILIGAYLYRANLSRADLSDANLRLATFSDADLSDADLSRADLSFATFVRTNLKGTTLIECRIYGISAWDIELTGALQGSLVITPPDEPIITVGNLKIAQFLYLLLNNQEIRDVITTITTKVVLILGRFTPERKTVLDALRNILHTKDYVPIIFDFDKPASKDTHETVTTLARLARFAIADITEAKSIPQELVSIVESLPSLAIQPLLQHDSEPWGMYDHIKRYPWVLPIHRYIDLPDLLATLEERVIDPAEHKAQELTRPS